jgi:hypothetical protein
VPSVAPTMLCSTLPPTGRAPLRHPGALLSCLKFDGTQEATTEKRMQVTVGSRTGLVAGVVCGVSLLVDGLMRAVGERVAALDERLK